MFRIIAELFLFNDSLNNQLVDYFGEVVKRGPRFSKENRKRELEKIFSGAGKIRAAKLARQKRQKVLKATNPVFDQKSGKVTPKKITPLTVNDVPVPRPNRRSIEKIFGSFGEKGKDWQQVPGKREIKGPAVNEMWRNFEKVSLPWGGETWFHKKIC